jgi:dGTPase
MDWGKLITDKRFGLEDSTNATQHNRTDFQRDYDRLVFSASFRRLQNKTQVFPLPQNIFVHNRLTHSLEVASVGRSLAGNVSRHLEGVYDNEPCLRHLGDIVAAACLAHDMGNPPFGHSGERAITDYFLHGDGRQLETDVRSEGGRWEDFLHFEGNANALRLLTHRFAGRRPGGFVLTYSTLAAIIKYPYNSLHAGTKGKFGYFRSEEDTYLRIAKELGIEPHPDHPATHHLRHPLTYLVEAADDICYQVMDIEDAAKLHIFTHKEAHDILMAFLPPGKHIKRNLVTDENEQLAYLRSTVIGHLVDECTRVFIENEQSILSGRYHCPLIQSIEPHADAAYKACSETAREKIYRARDVVDIELSGYHIFSRLITILYEALKTPNRAYSKILLRRIPQQYDTTVTTTYDRLQTVLDYISGMTDPYAVDLYHKIIGKNPATT